MFRTLRAFRVLFMGPLVLAMLVVINVMTSPGDWWVQWAALGIGIAWVGCLFRVIRAVAVIGGLAALIAYLCRKQPAWPQRNVTVEAPMPPDHAM